MVVFMGPDWVMQWEQCLSFKVRQVKKDFCKLGRCQEEVCIKLEEDKLQMTLKCQFVYYGVWQNPKAFSI